MERTEQMINMFTVKHMTYQEIGDEYGLSRERVRQILSAEGITREQGGLSQRTVKKHEKISAALETKTQKRVQKNYGCTFEEYTEINQGMSFYESPINWYRTKRRNSKDQNIKWELSLPDWWKIWMDSGKWDKRGRSKLEYVMTRRDLTKPFTKDNTIICTLQASTMMVRNHEKKQR